MELDDFLDKFNVISRIQGFVASIVHADWKGATQGPPIIGVAAEAARAVAGAGSWTFCVPRASGWTGGDVESLLKHYGVIVWGRRLTGRHFIMSVKERQANWAEYLILRQGIPLEGNLYNSANVAYAAPHAPGDRPPAWADRDTPVDEREDFLDRLLL